MPLIGPDSEIKVWAIGLDPVTATTDGYVAGHATRGKIGTAAGNKLRDSAATATTDLSPFVTQIRIDRGRRNMLEQPEPGRCVITLDATDRRFDPLHNAGPYNGGVSKQRFRRMLPIVVAVTGLLRADGQPFTRTLPLFSGWIDDIDYQYGPAGTLFSADVTCIDAFGLLADVTLPATDQPYGAGDTLTARMVRLCEAAGLTGSWSTPGLTVNPGAPGRYGWVACADGFMTLQGITQQTNALTAVKTTAASSGGWVWCANDGAVKWHGNIDTLPTTTGVPASDVWSTAVTSSRPIQPNSRETVPSGENNPSVVGNALPVNPSPRIDPDSWVTTVRLARIGGTERVGVATGIDTAARSELARTDLVNDNDSDVQALCSQTIDRYGRRPPVKVTFDLEPWLGDMAMFAALQDINTFFTWTWSAVGLELSGPLLAISHDIRPGRDWRARLTVCEWVTETFYS